MDWTDQARRQGGIIARSQLQALGYSGPAINGMLSRGRLVRAHAVSVYRAPGAPNGRDAACWVAVLAARAPLSYLSAAEIWGLEAPNDGRVHVTRFNRRRLVWPPGVRVHRVALDASAVTRHCGLPVTTRTETLLDCLGWVQLGAARTLADRAQQQRWLAPADIQRRLDNQPGRWGNRRLRLLLPTLGDGAHSEAERRLHALLRQAGVTGWKPNLPLTLGGQQIAVDVGFAARRIAIEIDGYRTHSRRERFQSDRKKGVLLATAGWTVLHFTWSDLADNPDYVIAAILSVLAP
jgi:very-short-patch-repair endonuclease